MRFLMIILLSILVSAQPREATCTITDTGGDDNYVGSCPAGTATVRLVASFANIGAATLSIDGGSTYTAIKQGGANDPADNAIPGNARAVRLYHDGTYWQIESSGGSAGGGGESTVAANSGSSGASILKDGTNVVARKLKAGANMTVTENPDDIELSATGTGGSVDPWTTIDLVDEFLGGGVTSTVIGELGWLIVGGNASSVGLASQDLGIWGFLRRNTAATANSFATMYVANGGNMSFPSGGNWTLTWRVRPASVFDANTVVQVGASCASNLSTDPANAIYFRASGASPTWFSVTRSSSSETATDTTQAAGTGWRKLVIRRVDAGTVGFRVDNNPEIMHTTNLPASQCNPWISVTNGATAAIQSLDIEFFRLQATGVAR
jgi:hypothetical protein